MSDVKYSVVKHIRYEVESDSGTRVLIIPNVSGAPDMKNVLCLSDTSLEIWNMITKEFTHSQIINTICETYQQEKTCITKDVTEFINGLLEKNYIRIVEQGTKDD